MRIVARIVIYLTMASWCLASTAVAPEIDGTAAASAIALVSGALLVLRGRRKK